MASRTCTSNRLSVEGCLLFMSRHVDLIYISLKCKCEQLPKAWCSCHPVSICDNQVAAVQAREATST